MIQPVRSVRQGKVSVQVLVHCHGAAGQRSTPAHRLALQAEILETDGVILVDGAPN